MATESSAASTCAQSSAIRRLAQRLFGAQGELLSHDEPPGARRILAEAIVAEHGWLSVEDLHQHPTLHVCAASLPAAACLGATLGDEGIVCVLSTVPRVWSQTDIATFEILVSAVEPLHSLSQASTSTSIVEMLPQLMSTARPDGYLNYFNQSWFAYAGKTLVELLGWGWVSLVHPDDCDRAIGRWREALRTGESCEFEVRLRRVDQLFRWHSFCATPLFKAGGIVKWCCACVDIDDRKRCESELEQVSALLSASIERESGVRADAERALRARDDFLAMVSHELRTPLSATLGWAHILRTEGNAATKLAPALESIERNSLRQAQLIDDLLDVSRMVAGQLHVQRFELDFRDVVENAVSAIRPMALAKSIDLDLRSPRVALCMLGDAGRLEQVVTNLLSNAIKFTPRAGRVTVELHAFENDVMLRVRDNGRGIRADFLPHVFERFSQAERGTRQAQGGLGLGLAIAERIVQLHGGSVTVESPGEHLGACFTVRLPLGEQRMAVQLPGMLSNDFDVASTEVDRLDDVSVLLVDDEEDIREMLAVALELRGASVRKAACIGEALQILEGWRPTVLVSDVGLAGEDGCDLVRQISARGPAIPAVAISGYTSAADAQRCLDAGFVVLVPKPFEPSALAVVLARLTGRAAAH